MPHLWQFRPRGRFARLHRNNPRRFLQGAADVWHIHHHYQQPPPTFQPTYCKTSAGKSLFNIKPIDQTKGVGLIGKQADLHLKDLASDISARKAALCIDAKAMRPVSNLPCTGYAGIEDGRAQFVDTFFKTLTRVKALENPRADPNACAALTAMADQESGFSEDARSWDSLCAAQPSSPYYAADGKVYIVPTCSSAADKGNYCSILAWTDYNKMGICDDKGGCQPIRGGFGPLQFDLMWYEGLAFGKHNLRTPGYSIPVSTEEQLTYILTEKLTDAEGVKGIPFPENIGTFFQSCVKTVDTESNGHGSARPPYGVSGPGSFHYTQGMLDEAVTACNASAIRHGYTEVTEDKMRQLANTACPFPGA